MFISSVTYRLKDERNALLDLLRVVGYEPLRFEEPLSRPGPFTATSVPGGEAAEVYVLLLGPKYGDPFPDSGLSSTARSFTELVTAAS